MRHSALPLVMALLAARSAPAQTLTQDAPANWLKEWRAQANGGWIMPLAGGKSATDLTTFRIRYPATFKGNARRITTSVPSILSSSRAR